MLACDSLGLVATEFKLIREVELTELINAYKFSIKTKKEINSILNGITDSSEVISLYKRFFKKSKWDLSKIEKFKFLAILNLAQECLPNIIIEKPYQVNYIKFFEFYRISYKLSINISSQEARREKIFGNTNFETINNQTEEFLQRARNDSAGIAHLIIGRKLTQKQFEELCDLAIDSGISFRGLEAYSIISGYKIQPQHERLFYPFIVYHYPQKIEDWIRNKIMVNKTEILISLENNYMIDGVRYWNSHSQKIIEAKKIFLKDGFKTIERNKLC